jgi:hypothetical protein
MYPSAISLIAEWIEEFRLFCMSFWSKFNSTFLVKTLGLNMPKCFSLAAFFQANLKVDLHYGD